MSNTREINPQVPVFTQNGVKNAKFLALTDFYDYHFNDGGGTVVFNMIGEQDNGTTTLEDGTIVTNPISFVTLYASTMQIPSTVVQNWGASDQIVFDYVAQQLGITLVATP